MCALAATPEARSVSAFSAVDEMAMHEMLEGPSGHRVAWTSEPALVVISTVLDYEHGDVNSGFVALDQTIGDKEVAQLENDLTNALDELTDDTFQNFSSITVESVRPGDTVKVVRPGQIVVARYRGVQKATGNLGFGGRLTHADTIFCAVMILDAAFDAKSDQRDLLRTHELGHALGYNHVESRPSVMNARMGSSITDFDRAAIHAAFEPAAGLR
jgi:hypothetical protein